MTNCPLCSGPLVYMNGEGKAICSDCKTWHTTEKPKTDDARAKKRSHRLKEENRNE